MLRCIVRYKQNFTIQLCKLTFYCRSPLIHKYNENWKESDTRSDGEDIITVSMDQPNEPLQGKSFHIAFCFSEGP